ncbi:MAG: hypothetical protein SFW08_11715 [Gemmatimonadaceae bacterium]|nr:hypothetical protein [Gemmatimonadaceae bacterium]
MYASALILHSLLRWAVVGLAVLALVRAFTGKDSSWSSADETPRRWLPIAVTVQFVLGLLLYGLWSPLTTAAMADMKIAMKDATLRFWAVEHITVMVIALALVHIGGARARKAATPASKRGAMRVFFGLATVLMLWGIPWVSRPLLRLSGSE